MNRQDRRLHSLTESESIESGIYSINRLNEKVEPFIISACGRAAGLTRREWQVLGMRMESCTWEYIGWEFNYSEATVRRIAKKAVIKLKSSTTADIVAVLAEVFHVSAHVILDILEKN